MTPNAGTRPASGAAPADALHESVFLKACRREKTPRTPVWLMRQAGRYMKEYRTIREKTPFLSICRDKDLVAEITVTAQEKIGADAAILFADILLIVEPFGLGLDFAKGDGPSIRRPVRQAADVEALPEVEPAESLAYVLDAARLTRSSLKPGVPLIGFAGAPFTLAAYMIEGGSSRDFEAAKRFLYDDPGAWKALMEKIARATSKYLNAQIDAGVQAVQLFDSWVGCLEPAEYEEYVLPYTAQVFRSLKPGVPAIHFGTGTAALLELMARAGGDVIGVDHRVPLDEAWKRVGYNRAIQGNMDPLVLCSSLENIKNHAVMILDQARGRQGHIFNLGHGVLPETPVENVIALTAMVREFSGKIQEFLG
ncbi:MAG TPA: uroporphyrinogen decarboxylase [Candidatus Eisenbacteria bacterium]|nr:uroporphyrinogen decarboxylase [Candidatus Eisenbacteria bacterium]